MEHSVTIALSIIAAAVAYIVRALTKKHQKPSQKKANDLADQRATAKLSEAEQQHLKKIEAAHSRTQAIIRADHEELSKLVNGAFDD